MERDTRHEGRAPLRRLFEPFRERICRFFCGQQFFDRDASGVIDSLTVELEAARERITHLEREAGQ